MPLALAVDNALSTGELLEGILRHLDPGTLLLSALRVSRHWHATINTSVHLQRVLYFVPEEDPTPVDGYIQPKRQNPLLRDLFPAWFENTNDFYPESASTVSIIDSIHAFPATAMMGYKRFKELPLYAASLGTGDNPFLRPSASWRRMLVSQPACRTIAISSKRGPGPALNNTLDRPVVSRRDDGLRMGELYRLTLESSAAYPISGFMIIWMEGADKGRANFSRHLKRISGVMPVMTEENMQFVWDKQPDLMVQMVHMPWTNQQFVSGGAGRAVERMFWAKCGFQGPTLVGEGNASADWVFQMREIL